MWNIWFSNVLVGGFSSPLKKIVKLDDFHNFRDEHEKQLSCHHPVFIGRGKFSGKNTPLDCPEKCTACQTSLKVHLLEGFLQKRALSDGFGKNAMPNILRENV